MSKAGADTDQSFIEEALPAFISEAQEQIESLEQLLLQLEDAPHDRELLDALFRCAHTVKGSAGIFGLDRVVSFTHHVETLLDRMRDGAVDLTPGVSTLLLRCNDEIRGLVQQAGTTSEEPPEVLEHREQLVAQLMAISAPHPAGSGGADEQDTEPAPPAGPTAAAELPPEGIWHVSIKLGVDTFRNGMDPIALLSYLEKLGDIKTVICDVEAIPTLAELDPESCHIQLELSLASDASQDDIAGAFSFVQEESQINILPPRLSVDRFVSLIESQPDNPRLGDILVASGAISRAQLNEGLARQAQTRAAADAMGEAGPPEPLGRVLADTAGVPAKVIDAALRKQQRGRDLADDTKFIRVHADRLDGVINLLGELVIAGAGAALLAHETRHSTLIEAVSQISTLIEEIRNGTLQLRMVQIGETFTRFRRVVRDTAAELGKSVTLDIVGGETELDKSVVERIADPLMHLVRNGLDHGLETPAERTAAGKPADGRLTLKAYHEAGSICISIVDDGRGIHRQKVLERAWERGLVELGVTPPDQDILQLIFAPGFSTAAQVTNLSGRGVGMDVVKRNIEALRGSVQVSSQEGQGTCIDIRLPLTLAIIDGFLVSVGDAPFIFPLASVVEVIEDKHVDGQLDHWGRTCVELRGQVLPVVSLRQLYGLAGREPERTSVVVIHAGGRSFGVMVDQLHGQHQTVIKPMARIFKCLRGISGSSILGTGEVALIFDVNALGELAAAERTAPVYRDLPHSPASQHSPHPH